jgi:predicted secreted Zn-dependent protease
MMGQKKVGNEINTKMEMVKTSLKQDDPAIKKVKEEVKKSLANVIKVYHPEKKSYLDVSMTEVTNDGHLK